MSKAFRQLVSISLLIVFVLVNTAVATEIMPRADTEFTTTAIVLKSSKTVSFRATTYEVKDSISVTACWLEIENDDGSWSTVCSLPTPSGAASQTFSFSTNADYSSYIGTGNYRIRATFNADGHTLTRTSNERSF